MSLPTTNRQWIIAGRPTGKPEPAHFALREQAIHAPGEGELLLETLYLGLVPVMRMYMQGLPVAGERALGIGEVIHARGVARVLASRHPDYREGEVLTGQLGWQTHKLTRVTPAERFYRVPTALGLPVRTWMSALSMTGFSAYFGLFDCARPLPGETVVVSGAGGGVGSMAVQLARLAGCRVVGITGGAEKCAAVRSLGAESVIDYRSESLAEALDDRCPDGVDVFFDNVGGDTLAVVMERLRFGARVVLCGSISEYTLDAPYGLSNYARTRRVNGSMQGFFIYNYEARFDEAERCLANWLVHGQLQAREDILEGFERMPEGLMRLYDSRNVGIQICRVSDALD